MADAVAIVGIVSSSSVAIAVAGIGAWQESRRLRWQERGARERELREILDAGAIALTDAWDKLGQRKVAAAGKVDATGQAFSDAVKDAQQATTRIVLRLGAHSDQRPLVATARLARRSRS